MGNKDVAAARKQSKYKSVDEKIPPDRAKEMLLGLLSDGYTVAAACQVIKKSEQTFYYYTSSDSQFKRAVELIRARQEHRNPLDDPNLKIGFREFRERFLQSKTFPHQQNMIDLLDGKEPSWLHPSMTYERRAPELMICNIPPNHCAEKSTPVLSANRGWLTVGDVEAGDFLYDAQGWPAKVAEVWEPDTAVDMYRITFCTGDTITTDGSHLWVVDSALPNSIREVPTEWLYANPKHHHAPWRIPVTGSLKHDPIDLPVDPYILGYWLGDGDSNGYRVAVSAEDLPALLRQLDTAGYAYKVSDQSGGHSVYIYGLTKHLRNWGIVPEKRIPPEFFHASHEQRLALLQGLMDTDGTITVKDSRARFVQVADRQEFLLDVYRLMCSLGLKPHWKEYRSKQHAPRGREYNTLVAELSFRTGEAEIFRLERKLARQKPLPEKNGKSQHRAIRKIEKIEQGNVKCITVLSNGNLFLVGDALIPTHNAKSMTVSVDYVTWRICMDPNIRVLIVSKTKELAKDFLYAIKQRLTHQQFIELQRAYAPPEGFEKEASQWSMDAILLKRSEAFEKDPTVQALGIGGQIYGSRADLIILDDCVTLSNVNEYEKQIRWLQQEVINRPQPGDRIMVLGTRVDSVDLYRELRNADRYPDGESPWTYLAMPAVLEFGEDPADWVTLWPKSDRPWKSKDHEPDAEGLFPRWDGHHLRTMRGRLDPKTWAMVYQQEDVQSDSVFAPDLVRAAVNGMRGCGPLVAGAPGYPATVDGMYTICSMDPAMSGDTFTIAYTGDRATKKRYVLDASRMTAPTPQRIREIIRTWTERYRPSVWVIEKNAFQLFLTQDEEINQYLASKGIRLVQHYTGANKMDAEFGVASMAPLFGSHDHAGQPLRNGLLELPRTEAEGMKALVEQLITWAPGMRGKQDGPMAMWFAETQMRKYLDQQGVYQETWIHNPFATRYDVAKRRVVDLESFAEEQQKYARQSAYL